MNNYKEKNQKNQVFSEIFKEFIKSLAFLKDFRRHSVLKFWESKFADKIVFVPQSFSWDEEKRKVNKKPLLKKSWKTEITSEDVKYWLGRIADSYSAGIYNAGVALRAEDQDIFVIDIDDVNKFSKYFSIENFLEDVKKDIYLITKSISKGYHIYLSPKLLQVPAGISNKDLLDNFGFEIKKQGLITFFPSAYRNGKELLSYDIFYVNPDNLEKRKVKSDSLKKIEQLVKDLHAEKQKKLEELQKIRRRINEKKRKLAEERESFSDFREVIDEVKRRVSFYDLIPEKFVKHCSHYDLYHCPFHQPDRTPSFAVYRDGEYEFGYDFHDNEGYDVISFYQSYHGVDFKTALKELCEIAGVEYPEKKKNITASLKAQKFQIEKLQEVKERKWLKTEKAFYTSPFSVSPKVKRRYAFLKKERELWEVEEIIKVMKSEEEYLLDQENAYEISLITKSEVQLKNRTYKGYTYHVFSLRKQIASFTIEEGMEYKDPLGSIPRFDFCIKTSKDYKKLKIEGITFEEFTAKLKNESLVISSQKIKDALSKCIVDLVNAEKIKQKVEIPKPGFFFFENTLKLSRIEAKEVEKEDFKSALLFLNELVEKHFSHVKEKFVTVLKWYITAPFTFAVKQKKNMLKGLYLFGSSGTGKSTMCLLTANIWRDFYKTSEKTGSSIDTIARLGNTLSQSTFPEIISEPQGALLKEDIMEAIKNAMTNTIVRGKYSYGQYVEIPALANIAFTSNHFVPKDDAFLRRFIILSFSNSEKPDAEKKKKFAEVKTAAEKLLSVIGNFIISNIDSLREKICSLSEENQLETAEYILEFLYRAADLEVPEWIFYKCETDYTLSDFENEMKFLIVSEIREHIYREAERIRDSELTDFEQKLRYLLSVQGISYIIAKNDKVYLTTKVLEVINQKLPHLKALAEILGYPCKMQDIRLGSRKTKISVISIPLEEFIELLFPAVEDEEEKAKRSEQENTEFLPKYKTEAEIDENKLPF